MTLLPVIESEPVSCPVERLPPINLALRDEAYTIGDQQALKWVIDEMKSHSFVTDVDYWNDSYPLRVSFTDVQKEPKPFGWKEFSSAMIGMFGGIIMPVPAHDERTYRVRVFYGYDEIFTQSYSYDYHHKAFVWYSPSYMKPPRPIMQDFAKRVLKDICGSIELAPESQHTGERAI